VSTPTLETLLKQIAQNQNDQTMREALMNRSLLTTERLQSVLRSLLDPTLVDDNFLKGLRKEYERLQSGLVLKSRRSQRDITFLEELQGAIGLVCFTLGILNEAGSWDQKQPNASHEWLQELFCDRTVRYWFYKVYEPSVPAVPGSGLNNSAQKKREAYQIHWENLKNENKCLELYRIGTTSFILRCRISVIAGTELVLKCLIFPYTQIVSIVDATYNYAETYNPEKIPRTAKVRSSTDKWILMDFIEGPTLRELLDKRKKEEEVSSPPLLRTDLLVSIGQPLLQALSSLPPHVQHEDLSPSNIIVSTDDNGTYKIVFIDLGRNYLYLQKKIWLAESRETLFIAPEVKNGNKSSDKSDLYSFGMILIDLADPFGAQDTIVPNSIYQYAPTLARFIEDLIDVKPNNRLRIFPQDKEDLLNAFAHELTVLPSDQEVKPGLRFNLWGRYIEIKPSIHFWIQQFLDLFYPADQLTLLWRLTQLQGQSEIARYTGRLHKWLIFCTIHWNIIFILCLGWGLWRDLGAPDFSPFMTLAQKHIFHCDSCIPILDGISATGKYSENLLANLPARLTIFSVIAQTKYYQNVLAKLTAKPIPRALARFTEMTLRGSAICSLIPILFCNLYQPRLWLVMLVLGYTTVGINNILSYRLATRSLNLARSKNLSTVPRFNDPALEAFETWGQNMIVYMVLLLIIWIGLLTGLLRDEWIYVIGTVGVSIFVWTISKCIKLAPSLRGSLHRAFIAGERYEVIP
jgi:serine/threonine protein kinase